ncbi:serine hydrolase [Demequina sp. NBRC 110056]|uniref:serine hydrolase domain-containing protein n=1 Tax=Demequina sp. NBRC 110056 TaxID=1570345 RepID=UPI00190EE8BD|nr:serine hydrolase domain-containing protein [Demequina sp. NBRC 110056]
MRPRSVIAALAATLAVATASAAASAPQEEIDAFIATAMPESKVPGLAYSVVEEGSTTVAAARGVTRQGTDTAVTADTPFVIGSISKSFTALAVMQLVEAGSVDLDGELETYLDSFSGQPAGPVTVRQLLSHTSGYSTLQGNTAPVETTGEVDDLARGVDALADVAPAYAPGSQWEYSNTNYQIAGRLIEVVSGEEFATYVESHVLEPLGMNNSSVADGEEHPSMATGHTPWFWTKRPVPDGPTQPLYAPQGGVIASANDLALYMAAMMNDQDDVLSAEGKATMMRPANAAWSWYGLGWFIDTAAGTVWHSGSTPGIETLLTMAPGDDAGVAVLTNGGSGIGFGETTELRDGITALALGRDYDGEGSALAQQALFVSLSLLPMFYLAAMAWAWFHHTAIRAKRSGIGGLFSLWFPLLTTIAAAVVILWLVPRLMGAPMPTLRVFQPDMALVMTATAVMGVVWSVTRLAVAYTGARPVEDQG